MSNKKICTTVNLPEELVYLLDRDAEKIERSRSWVVAGIIKQHYEDKNANKTTTLHD